MPGCISTSTSSSSTAPRPEKRRRLVPWLVGRVEDGSEASNSTAVSQTSGHTLKSKAVSLTVSRVCFVSSATST